MLQSLRFGPSAPAAAPNASAALGSGGALQALLACTRAVAAARTFVAGMAASEAAPAVGLAPLPSTASVTLSGRTTLVIMLDQRVSLSYLSPSALAGQAAGNRELAAAAPEYGCAARADSSPASVAASARLALRLRAYVGAVEANVTWVAPTARRCTSRRRLMPRCAVVAPVDWHSEAARVQVTVDIKVCAWSTSPSPWPPQGARCRARRAHRCERRPISLPPSCACRRTPTCPGSGSLTGSATMAAPRCGTRRACKLFCLTPACQSRLCSARRGALPYCQTLQSPWLCVTPWTPPRRRGWARCSLHPRKVTLRSGSC